MRKFLLLITMSLILLLSACTDCSGIPIKPNENNMIINIKNNSNFEFYGLGVRILDHSPTSVNADGSKIEKGESFMFELLEDDLHLDGNVEMEVAILSEKNSEEILLNNKISLELNPNKELFFELTGDSIEQAELKRDN